MNLHSLDETSLYFSHCSIRTTCISGAHWKQSLRILHLSPPVHILKKWWWANSAWFQKWPKESTWNKQKRLWLLRHLAASMTSSLTFPSLVAPWDIRRRYGRHSGSGPLLLCLLYLLPTVTMLWIFSKSFVTLVLRSRAYQKAGLMNEPKLLHVASSFCPFGALVLPDTPKIKHLCVDNQNLNQFDESGVGP